MNKNLLFILYIALAVVGMIAVTVIAVIAPQQFDKVAQLVITILGLASAAAGTFYLLGNQQKTLEEVKTNTNGNLTALRELIAQKDAQLAEQQRQMLQVVGSAPPPSG